jgi:hypothetical protein
MVRTVCAVALLIPAQPSRWEDKRCSELSQLTGCAMRMSTRRKSPSQMLVSCLQGGTIFVTVQTYPQEILHARRSGNVGRSGSRSSKPHRPSRASKSESNRSADPGHHTRRLLLNQGEPTNSWSSRCVGSDWFRSPQPPLALPQRHSLPSACQGVPSRHW